jgi:hypothetical protein
MAENRIGKHLAVDALLSSFRDFAAQGGKPEPPQNRQYEIAARVLNFLTENNITDTAGLNAKAGAMNRRAPRRGRKAEKGRAATAISLQEQSLTQRALRKAVRRV